MAYKLTEARDLGVAYKPTEAGFQPRRKGLVVDYYFKAPQCEAHSGECHWLAFLKASLPKVMRALKFENIYFYIL
jgi:hypothetical protein